MEKKIRKKEWTSILTVSAIYLNDVVPQEKRDEEGKDEDDEEDDEGNGK
jgi:hypothetical protein